MDTVAVERRDGVATVSLLGTTMPPQLFFDVGDTFRELSADEGLRAVILKGAGKVFSYGLDLPATLQELGPHLTAGGLAASRMALHGLIRRLQACFTAVAECPVPVIAAIHGWCIGGGLDLVSACDIRLCSRDARFSLRETRIAIVADLGSLQRLPAIIGKGHMRELAFTGGDIDAARAAAIGLVNHVHDDVDGLRRAAEDLAGRIAANSPLTVRGVKNVLDACEGRSTADGLAYVAAWNSAFLASEDLAEAMQAFMQKREPQFKT